MRTEYQKAYRQANKETLAEQEKAYRQANKEALAERRKAYQKANREAIAKKSKAYQKANKEALAKKSKAYREANSHIIYALNAKRRAIKLQATPPWANKEHINSIYLLASINRKAGHDVQVDHIVPLRSDMVCGLHCESNLQLLQGSDNISKGNRHWPDQW